MPGSGQSKPASDAATGLPVDQTVCQAGEQTLFHIHAHLAIFVNGMARQVPAAIGIPVQAEETAHGPFIARAPVLTGCTPTPPTASSTSSLRSSGPIALGSSSMNGDSRWDRAGRVPP